MKSQGLRTTIYQVNDIVAAKDWYAKAFQTEPYFDEVFYVGFNIGGYELGLHPNNQDANAKTDSVVSYWGVDDVDFSFKELISLGAKSFEEPQDVGGGIIVATVQDPWGNVIGLIYNPHFK